MLTVMALQCKTKSKKVKFNKNRRLSFKINSRAIAETRTSLIIYIQAQNSKLKDNMPEQLPFYS
jgi:hypothetical protein